MHVCSAWQAAVLAAPELEPTMVLTLPPLLVIDSGPDGVSAYQWRCSFHDVARAQHRDIESAENVVAAAAQLSPLARRVRLEGFLGRVSHVAGLENGGRACL
jgi:hypothetical protein